MRFRKKPQVFYKNAISKKTTGFLQKRDFIPAFSQKRGAGAARRVASRAQRVRRGGAGTGEAETEARGMRRGAGEARWAWARRGQGAREGWGRARRGSHGGRGAGRGRINGEGDETEQGRGGAPAPTQRAPAALTTPTVAVYLRLTPAQPCSIPAD